MPYPYTQFRFIRHKTKGPDYGAFAIRERQRN